MQVLRAGLIGLGMMGRNHLRVLGSLDGVELVAVADVAIPATAVPTGLPVVPGVEELLALGIDYCVIAVPTIDHEQIGLTLAAAGVHALVEKPLSRDVASSRRLAAAFEQAGLVGAVGHIERYNPSLLSLRSRLEQGDLGDVYQVATRRQGPFPSRIADVGVVKDLATHDIDSTSWVTQQSYRSVSARTTHRSGRDHEDLVAVLGQMADGTITNHLVNWLSPMKERVTVVTGERGTFVADTLTADLTFYANGTTPEPWASIAGFRGVTEGDVVRYGIIKPEPLRTEHEAFRDAVVGRSSKIVTMQEGLRNMVVAEAVLESAANGRTVEVADA